MANRLIGLAIWLIIVQLSNAHDAGIRGTITSSDNGNLPLEGIRVEAFHTEEGPGGAAVSDTEGNYTIYPLSNGTYIVRFYDPERQYAPESFDQIPGHDFAYDQATVIELDGGSIRSNINASLRTGSILSGRVTRTNDMIALPNIFVEAFEMASGHLAAWAFSDDEGEFTLNGLAAGSYRIRFQDPDKIYAAKVYGGQPGIQIDAGGQDIELESAMIRSNIHAQLSLAGRLSGLVTGSTESAEIPLPGIYVESLHLSTMSWGPWTYTDEEGRYELKGLLPGDYRVRFQDDTYLYSPRIYASLMGDDIQNEGTPISIQVGITISNVNEILMMPARLSGQVTHGSTNAPVEDAVISVFYWTGNIWAYQAFQRTDAEGRYTFILDQPGEYILLAEPPDGSQLLGLWYDNVLFVPPQNSTISLPDGISTVTLDSGTELTDIDFQLPRASRIVGSVFGLSAIPLEGGFVKAYHVAHNILYQTSILADGSFNIDDLLPGEYRVRANRDGFAAEWWSNRSHRSQADLIELHPGVDHEILFDLSPGQQPAWLHVDSGPQGAAIYIDHRSTGEVTPALINVGEVAMDTSDLMPRSVSVISANNVRSPVYEFYPVEAETPGILFYMTEETGSLRIDSDPEGATVFVNDADDPVGSTPITVSNLILHAAGHWIRLQKDGYLQPAPIRAEALADGTEEIVIELTPDTGTGMPVDVYSLPPEANLYVNFSDTGARTDQQIGGLDPSVQSGDGWTSAPHSVQPKKTGYLLPLARKVVGSSSAEIITVPLLPDESYLETFENRNLALYNLWAEAYGGTNEIGAIDEDRLEKGLSNWEQMLAGLDPRDPTSRLAFSDSSAFTWDSTGVRLEWPSVPGRRYIVQKTHGLREPWSSITGLILATHTNSVIIDPAPDGSSNTFYRIQVVPPHL